MKAGAGDVSLRGQNLQSLLMSGSAKPPARALSAAHSAAWYISAGGCAGGHRGCGSLDEFLLALREADCSFRSLFRNKASARPREYVPCRNLVPLSLRAVLTRE
ncbi:hypothetical protein NDU88_000722 [Pleurodeles waltl]|uniref:Uncharacterized protein n=1 Tax=Pleurodeles waltl TaxID=8319 RepID=A0AAV7L7N9_PLEWA|nr:hypothetical protein NDU88_000722 [Pleurodeles waltl]